MRQVYEMSDIEIIEMQNTIIKMQSDAIKELFLILSQHMQTDEIERLMTAYEINNKIELNQTKKSDK